jgi:hypothetical protein
LFSPLFILAFLAHASEDRNQKMTESLPTPWKTGKRIFSNFVKAAFESGFFFVK